MADKKKKMAAALAAVKSLPATGRGGFAYEQQES